MQDSQLFEEHSSQVSNGITNTHHFSFVLTLLPRKADIPASPSLTNTCKADISALPSLTNTRKADISALPTARYPRKDYISAY